MHKYLNDLGVKSDETCIFNTENKDDNAERWQRFQEERKEHSFDSRETWSLDFTSATWLYEHLKAFKDYADKIVDLDAIEFDVPILYRIPDDRLEYRDGYSFPVSFLESKTERKTQREAIDIMCQYLKNFLLDKEVDTDVGICDMLSYEYLKGAFRIYAEIIPSMWW